MVPKITIQKTDGNLGVTSDTDRILAVIAPASAGAFTPAALTNSTDVKAAYTSGKLVRAASYLLGLGISCVFLRASATTAGAYGTLVTSKTGTAAVANGVTAPDDDYDVIVKIVNGGALGTAGITFVYSLDNGGSYSAEQALGTGLTLTCSNGVSFALTTSTSTLIAGDSWKVPTTGPRLTSSDLVTAYAALRAYDGEWLRTLVLGSDADATILAGGNTFALSFHADGKYPEVIMGLRTRPVTGETEAAYLTAMAAVVNGVQSDEVSPVADQCEIVIDGLRLREPFSLPYAARTMLNDDSQDPAAKADGALPGVFLKTADGARSYHDERLNPGLDALGITTARTWGSKGSKGVYVNNGRLLSGADSDYQFFQLSAIVNRIIETTFQKLEPRLSQGVLLNAETGTIREDVAKSIEDSVNAELRASFSDPGRVSGVRVTLSRTDNVLSTNKISFSVNVQPLGYVKEFTGKVGLVRTLPIAA